VQPDQFHEAWSRHHAGRTPTSGQSAAQQPKWPAQQASMVVHTRLGINATHAWDTTKVPNNLRLKQSSSLGSPPRGGVRVRCHSRNEAVHPFSTVNKDGATILDAAKYRHLQEGYELLSTCEWRANNNAALRNAESNSHLQTTQFLRSLAAAHAVGSRC